MPLTYQVQTPAPIDPISVSDFKSHARIDGNDSDETIRRIISAATEYLEGFTRRRFIQATIDYYLDHWPVDCILVPLAPLASVDSITYVDCDGATQTWDSSLYDVDTVSEPGRIKPAYSQCWPSMREGLNAVRVRCVIGYGAAMADVPAKIRQAHLLVAGDLFENRELNLVLGVNLKMNPTAHALIRSFCRPEAF